VGLPTSKKEIEKNIRIEIKYAIPRLLSMMGTNVPNDF
jgi:hypothetical protein